MTHLPAVTASFEAALLRIHPISGPLERIRAALDASYARQRARRDYRYLLDNEAARRDSGISADDARRALEALR